MRWIIAVCLLSACGSSSAGDDGVAGIDAVTGNGHVFDPDVTQVIIEIDYETGQEPFTGPVLGMGDTFDLSQANLERLLSTRKTLTLPRVVADMEDVGNIPDEELTVPDVLALADAHRAQHDRAGVKTFYVIFVSGHFATAAGVQNGVLGVSIGNTGVLVMFKDVIRSTGVVALPNVVRFVEQAVMIHELGHGFGLVDNGVPMTSLHKDTENGAHCDNDQCVMYFTNDGAADAARFVQQKVTSGNTILFDAHCLADVDAINHP